jgi:hypothetical protein
MDVDFIAVRFAKFKDNKTSVQWYWYRLHWELIHSLPTIASVHTEVT